MRISDWSSDVCSSDLSWCIGCGSCAKNCPYGNINMHGIATTETVDDPNVPGTKLTVVREKATMCDLCHEDRKSVVKGTSVSVRVALGGRRIINITNKVYNC